MFGVGLPEFLVLCVGALLVLGPKRLPEALRTLGLWQRRIASSYRALRWELEREPPPSGASDSEAPAAATAASETGTDAAAGAADPSRPQPPPGARR